MALSEPGLRKRFFVSRRPLHGGGGDVWPEGFRP